MLLLGRSTIICLTISKHIITLSKHIMTLTRHTDKHSTDLLIYLRSLFISVSFCVYKETGGLSMSWKVIEVPEMDFRLLKEHNVGFHPLESLLPNTPVEVRSPLGVINAIYDPAVGVRKLNDKNPYYKKSQNRDLALYNDMLSNENVNTIIVDGFFGTGKTSNVMTHLVEYLKNGERPKVYISKPHVPVGASYGHLPGDLMEKLHHEFRSFYQYIDRFWGRGMVDKLLAVTAMGADTKEESMFFKQYGQIEFHVLPFEYIRGLDIEEGWVILDETQNTNIQEVASFVSRLGQKVKFVALGDMTSAQIDRKSVSAPERNGFNFLKEVYKDKPYSGFVGLNTRNHILRGDRVKHLHDAISSLNS